MKQVERGHWSNEAKEYYYAKRAAALGVRERRQIISIHQLVSSSPSQAEHAESLGVIVQHSATDGKKDRKEIMSDPELVCQSHNTRGLQRS